MKKKILLKSLVAITPLIGVLAPLTSCATTDINQPLKTLNTDKVLAWCPIIVPSATTHPHTVKATEALPIPDLLEELPEQAIPLACEAPGYVVKDALYVEAVGIAGTTRLVEGTDYTIETRHNAPSTIKFTKHYINGALREQLPDFILIAVGSKNIKATKYNININNLLVDCNISEVEDMTEGVEAEFTIKNDYKTLYKFDNTTLANFKVKLGRGQMSTSYKEIDTSYYGLELESDSKIKLKFTESEFDLSGFDPNSNNLVFDIPVVGIGQYDATIQLFQNETIESIPDIFTYEQSNFELKFPKEWHGKMPKKVQWRYADESVTWHECIIDSTTGSQYLLIKSNPDETFSINKDVIINVAEVKPVNPENAFENESWADLGYWVSKVYIHPFTPDADKEATLKKIYGLDSDDTFVGKHKTVEWGDVEPFHGPSKHDVVVASTFQANTVTTGKEDNLILRDGDYDTEHHAAFTFQFNNLLTSLVSTESESHYGPIKRKFDANHVSDWNTNCWVENATRSGFESSDLRNFLNGNDSDDFLAQLQGDSANIRDFIKPIASCHLTQSDFLDEMRGSQRYICDRVFIPTARQINCVPRWIPIDPENVSKEKHEWYSEDENIGDPVFEIYMDKQPTDGACDYRQFKVSPTWGGESIPFWLATPINDAPIIDDANTLVIKTDGSIDDFDKSSKHGVLPCFCF